MIKTLRLTKQKFFIIGSISIVALVAGGLAYYFFFFQAASPVVTTDYSALPEDEVKVRLQQDTGLDLDKVKQQNTDTFDFKSEGHATVAAKALQATGDNEKAYEVYKYIDQNYSGAKTAQYYEDASIAADNNGDVRAGTEYLKLARQQVANDSSLNSDVKKDKLERFDNKISSREEYIE